MCDASPVSGQKYRSQLASYPQAGNPHTLLGRAQHRGHTAGERLAFQVLHHEPRIAIALAEVEDLHNARVPDLVGGACLSNKALKEFWVRAHVECDDL